MLQYAAFYERNGKVSSSAFTLFPTQMILSGIQLKIADKRSFFILFLQKDPENFFLRSCMNACNGFQIDMISKSYLRVEII